jgi:hypothetical protein
MPVPTEGARTPLVPEDVERVVEVGSPLITPDGTILYTATRWRAGRLITELIAMPPEGRPQMLVAGRVETPALSPDGQTVAYIGDVQGATTVPLDIISTCRYITNMSKLVGVAEAAKFLGVSKSTLPRWERAGKLLPDERTFGGPRRYDLARLRPHAFHAGSNVRTTIA